jgi:hypothetical protein
MTGFPSLVRTVQRSGCLAVLAAVCGLLFGSARAQIGNPERTEIPSGPFRIAGTVVNSKSGSPLARSRVTISDAKKRQSVQSLITGDDGRFEFHVPAGKYSLQGAKRGFIPGAYNQHEQFWTAIVTGADLDTESLTLRLTPSAVLVGTVLDEFGDPVRHAQVTVYREDHSQGATRVGRSGSASTDDQGRYEVTPLDEGRYFVSANASPWYAIHPTTNREDESNRPAQVDPALDVAYPVTYYMDATESEGATPIAVRGGDRVEADIHLNPVPSLHLTVRIPENANHSYQVPSLRKVAFDGLEVFERAQNQMIAPGVFELSGIAAGRYMVQMFDSNGQAKEPTAVDLNGGGELDLSSAGSLSKIKATVQVEGTASLPAELRIGLRDGKGRTSFTMVDTKGEASFPGLASGRYEFVAGSPMQRYSVVRIVSDAGTISGNALNVPPGVSLALRFTLVGGSVTVEGFAKRAGKAAPGAMIVLVPENPEANRDRFRRDQSDLDGSFSLAGVIPGAYTIVAIEDGWDLNWSEAAVLAGYLKNGKKIAVGDRSSTTTRLSDPIEVQTK